MYSTHIYKKCWGKRSNIRMYVVICTCVSLCACVLCMKKKLSGGGGEHQLLKGPTLPKSTLNVHACVYVYCTVSKPTYHSICTYIHNVYVFTRVTLFFSHTPALEQAILQCVLPGHVWPRGLQTGHSGAQEDCHQGSTPSQERHALKVSIKFLSSM